MRKLQFPLKVFISYSHHDKIMRDHMMKHLSSLIRQKYIELWYDDMILPGSCINDKIFQAMMECDIALLLISADYLASDYCYSIEMETFMKLQNVGKVVIPVLLRPVDLKATPFEGLKSLPEDRKAVSSFSNQDDAMTSIASGIRKVVENAYREEVPGMKGASKRNTTMQDVSSSHVNYGFEFYGNEINGGLFENKR